MEGSEEDALKVSIIKQLEHYKGIPTVILSPLLSSIYGGEGGYVNHTF